MTEKTKVKREVLGQYSAMARDLKKKWINEAMEEGQNAKALQINALTLNSIIIDRFYKKDGHEDFRTFGEWKQSGFKVKKGSRGFIIWGRPIGNQKAEKGEEASDEDYSYFPVCYLFSNLQVEAGKEAAHDN